MNKFIKLISLALSLTAINVLALDYTYVPIKQMKDINFKPDAITIIKTDLYGSKIGIGVIDGNTFKSRCIKNHNG